MLLQERMPTHSKGNPTIRTLNQVLKILEDESLGDAQPLSWAEIERRMPAKQTRRETIQAAVKELEAFGIAAIGTKGVFFTATPPSVTRRTREPL